MASLIPGYEYDIFISYRQKDNKYDGWVTEFVDNLKKELEATFKEEISVYFDINPHDGLLETHDVDASLKDKLKCLVFIPIISRTYCDPKSFAWEHEFKAFLEQTSRDQYGLKVKLPNGNVASRVLPVRIHDLDTDDIKECESVLGGALRGIEFIYKEPGIDKPLAPGDNEKKNLNNTLYRIQIIKVALAIKEIILGMKTEPVQMVKEQTSHIEIPKEVKKAERKEIQDKPTKLSKRKLLIGSIILVTLIVAAILAYPKIFKRETLEKLRSSGERISIAVMPFQNMTNDTTKNDWQDWIQDILITSLSNSEELKVRQSESINTYIQSKDLTNYASITPSVASTIAQKLDVNIFIYGSIIQVGSAIRLNAQIIDSKTKEVFKSFQIDGNDEKILPTIDSLSRMLKNYLIISKLEKNVPLDVEYLASTSSPEAYKYFIYGNNAYVKRDWSTEVNMLSHALEIDSNFVWAAVMLCYAYSGQGLYDQAKEECLKLYKKRDQMSMQLKIWVDATYSEYFETPNETIKNIKQLLKIDDQMPNVYYFAGYHYNWLYQYDNTIPELEKCLEIYYKWGIKPWWAYDYSTLGVAYHKTGQYKKERELYKKAEQDFPDDPAIIYRQVILALTERDTIEANQYIKKYLSILKNNPSSTEPGIASSLAGIYYEAGILDKAEKYYRQALSSEPENPVRMNNLAYFLIDKDRNIKEGLELVNKALETYPNHFGYLHTKGLGLYKQGKYKEALEILQNSWDLRMKNAIYNHEAYLHLEAAKKAVAGQKNN